ncbi:hypothetical protein QBC34DRAFT_375442 [Podospora aff. communis PSN243]|uniref:C2H2-type domain-containing protein n=1 Tax=Podospora aff. communis PSN243 TaxID=3040156 RepID=A0AAV9H2R7_9PEZI|nr:hypothetical protein QBC34DRAFT_375442 [Podospora aff. communis PSN243]
MAGEAPASNVGIGGRPANAPSKPTSVADFGKLACPFLEEFQLAEHKTCGNGSKDVKHLKEHLKKHHDCTGKNCSTPCEERLHMTPEQLDEVVRHTHLQGESIREQWLRLYRAIFPGTEGTPAPCTPTIQQVVWLCQPGDHLAVFLEQFSRACGNKQQAEQFLKNLPSFVTLLRHAGVFSDGCNREGGEHVPEFETHDEGLHDDRVGSLEAVESDGDEVFDELDVKNGMGYWYCQQRFLEGWKDFPGC